MNINVHIEISKGSNIKYEFDHKANKLVCDRIIKPPFKYNFNYGYIPNTLSGDGDPLDVIVISDEVFHPLCYVNCKILGVLKTKDENGIDHKLITVPSDEVDPDSKDIKDINDINKNKLNQIKYFFLHYKDLEKDKWVEIDSFENKEKAIEILKESIENFEKCQ